MYLCLRLNAAISSMHATNGGHAATVSKPSAAFDAAVRISSSTERLSAADTLSRCRGTKVLKRMPSFRSKPSAATGMPIFTQIASIMAA